MAKTNFNLLSRDRDILEHLIRYDVGLLATISKSVFEGGEPGRPLSFLVREGLVERSSRSLENNVTYFRATAEAYRALGLKVRGKMKPLSKPALDAHIAVACACHLGEHWRHRITHKELVEITESETDAPPANIIHLASHEIGWPCLMRVVFAKSVGQVCEKLQRHIEETKRNPTLAPWMLAGDYGFIVLVPWADKLAEVKALIAESDLSKRYVIVADVGPDTTTLAILLKQRKVRNG